MIILIVLTISAILAAAHVYSSVRVEAQRQESRQKTRLHRSLSTRFKDDR